MDIVCCLLQNTNISKRKRAFEDNYNKCDQDNKGSFQEQRKQSISKPAWLSRTGQVGEEAVKESFMVEKTKFLTCYKLKRKGELRKSF